MRVAQTAAYTHGGDYLDQVLDGLEHNGALLQRLLRHRSSPGRRPLRRTSPGSTCTRFGEDPARTLLHQGRLAVNPGRTFGAEGAGHVRLNFATSTAILTEAAARLARLGSVATDS